MKFFRSFSWLVLCGGILHAQQGTPETSIPESEVMGTFSVVAWDSATGDLGVAVQSKFLGVGAVVPYARADVGAVATQAWANTEFGPRGLEMLGRGESARQAVEELIQTDSNANRRQLAIVDAHGSAFAYTGSGCQQFAVLLVPLSPVRCRRPGHRASVRR